VNRLASLPNPMPSPLPRPFAAALAAAACVLAVPMAAIAEPPADSGDAAVPLRLDGGTADWKGRTPTAEDPRGDTLAGPIDFGGLWLAETPDALWVLLEVSPQAVNLQSMAVSVEVAVDLDADARTPTGKAWGGSEDAPLLTGADLVIRFSPASDDRRGRGRGTAVEFLRDGVAIGRRDAATLSAAAAGIGAAPSYASERIELRLPRAVRGVNRNGLLFGDSLRIAARAVDGRGREIDVFPAASHAFSTRAAAPPRPERGLLSPSLDALRTVSWNLENGGHRTNAGPFSGVLKELSPRLLLLQELSSEDTAESLAKWLDAHAPVERGSAEPWRVVVSGGRIPVAVAFRGAIETVPGLDPVKRPSPGGPREMRAIGGIVEFGGRRLLAVSVHLKCCGNIGSGEDATREAEAQAIRDAIREAIERNAGDRPIEGLVIGGDFNLVGSREILFLAGEGIDFDGSDLAEADLPSLDDLSVATWGREESEFFPGQLDFMLFSDASLALRKGRVADPALLLRGGKGNPSDHLPIVADFAWNRTTPSP
jgi:endonuclease/exonuclease/phosphatase family metal-dependent hydrolase